MAPFFMVLFHVFFCWKFCINTMEYFKFIWYNLITLGRF